MTELREKKEGEKNIVKERIDNNGANKIRNWGAFDRPFDRPRKKERKKERRKEGKKERKKKERKKDNKRQKNNN